MMIDPLAAAPAVCTASVSALPATGTGVPLWLALAALALAALGAVALLLRRRAVAGAVVAATLVAAVVLVPAAPAAHAAHVDYGTGCTLFQVDDVAFSPAAGDLLPGDVVPALTALVTNRYPGPIELDGVTVTGAGPLAGAVGTEVDLDGAPGPVTLPPGGSVLVTVTVSVPVEAVDGLQGLSSALTLSLTATAS